MLVYWTKSIKKNERKNISYINTEVIVYHWKNNYTSNSLWSIENVLILITKSKEVENL
jgi:hypothetical protein